MRDKRKVDSARAYSSAESLTYQRRVHTHTHTHISLLIFIPRQKESKVAGAIKMNRNKEKVGKNKTCLGERVEDVKVVRDFQAVGFCVWFLWRIRASICSVCVCEEKTPCV